MRVSTRQHFNIAHSNYIFARPSEYGEYIRQILAKANIRFSEYANTVRYWLVPGTKVLDIPVQHSLTAHDKEPGQLVPNLGTVSYILILGLLLQFV